MWENFRNFVANKAVIVPFVTVKLLEFMDFCKAIQIKSWVNRFNQERNQGGFPVIVFKCDMYSIGHWSIELTLSYKGVFFYEEMNRIITLYAGGGFIFFVGSVDNSPKLYFQ